MLLGHTAYLGRKKPPSAHATKNAHILYGHGLRPRVNAPASPGTAGLTGLEVVAPVLHFDAKSFTDLIEADNKRPADMTNMIT